MRSTFLLLMTALFSPSAIAAFERSPGPGPGASMGGAGVAGAGTVWSSLQNPASLPPDLPLTIAFSAAPRPFNLPQLARTDFLLLRSLAPATAGLHASRFGFDLYREVTVGALCTLPVTDDVAAGLAVHWYSLAIAGYGSSGTVGVDLGFLVRFDESVAWGGSVTNLNAPSIGEISDRLPQTFATGIRFSPVDDFAACLDVVKDTRFPLELRFGVDLAPHPWVHLRFGTAAEPATWSAGVGVRILGAGFDYAWTTHPELGATHEFSLLLIPQDF